MCGRACCRGEPNAAESHKHLFKPVICLLAKDSSLLLHVTHGTFQEVSGDTHMAGDVSLSVASENRH